MHHLTRLYFDQYAIIYLIQWILALAALLYFLHLREQASDMRAATLLFGSLVGLTGAEWVRSTAVWERQFVATQVRYVFLYIVLYAVLQIAYKFPQVSSAAFERQRQRELSIFSTLYAGVVVIALGVVLYQSRQLRPGGHPQSLERLFDIGVVLASLHFFTVLLRRAWYLARPLRSGQVAWRHLPLEQRNTLRILLNLLGINLLVFVSTSIRAFASFELLPALWREVIPSVGVLFFTTLLLTTLLNTTLQHNSLIVRLVTPVLLTVFVVLGLVSLISAQNLNHDTQVRPARLPAQTLFFQRQAPGSYRVSSQAPQFTSEWGMAITTTHYALPFVFPLAGTHWKTLALDPRGILAFGTWNEIQYAYNNLPAISLLQSQNEQPWHMFGRADASRAWITWQNPNIPTVFFQIVLYANGDFALSFSELAGAPLQRIGFQSGRGGTAFAELDVNQDYVNTEVAADGLLTDFTILQRQADHLHMLPLAYMVLAFSLVSIVGFPLLFWRVLVQPLNDLVAGVRAVEAGEMDTQVPVHASDEIGLVTQAFNQMVCAILEAELKLEERVAARSRDLVESERRLGALEERERIGRELHDDLGQVMVYVQMQSETALGQLEKNDLAQTRQRLDEIAQTAQEAHANVRQYILGIRTDRLSTRADARARPTSLWDALDDYLALVHSRYGLDIALTAPAELRQSTQLSPKVEAQVLRIIQEGLTNIYKHAQANRVDLVFTRQGDWLHVLLVDDGRGFEVETLPDTGAHFGQHIMRERAEGINGQFEVTSTPGDGTRLQIRVPCILDIETPTEGQRYSWRVLLVDDHALFREGLSNMLRPHGLQIVGAAQNGIEAESLAEELRPELILMDIHMPERDGLEATRRIKQRFPQIKIVMLTVAAEDALLLQALQNGASGYLLKNLPIPQFLSLLTDVMAGKVIISPTLANRALTNLAQAGDTALAGASKAEVLTPRQQEVLGCIGQGMSNHQIAEELFITENTVKYHVGQIMKRLGLQTRHELIRYQFDHER